MFVVLHEITVRGDQPSFSHIGTVFLLEAVTAGPPSDSPWAG